MCNFPPLEMLSIFHPAAQLSEEALYVIVLPLCHKMTRMKDNVHIVCLFFIFFFVTFPSSKDPL